ncbi:MAG: hypothetical protein IPP26_04965 [Flavobacteriales bacterium]|nr:hypothetical protein [Flavobacteriales bacterium]
MTNRSRSYKAPITLSLIGGAVLLMAFLPHELINAGSAAPATQFMNFESAHVHPIDMTPDGTKLLAVNTANNTLEVFQVTGTGLLNTVSIPVGLDPVTVRVRSNTEAWVVDQVSDAISIVDLSTNTVVRSLATENEPADVVFAGSPQKAFVSCAERESIQIFDPSNLSAAPGEVLLKGEQPRAMAVSPDGSTVYTAFFESGNRTTVVSGNPFLGGGFCSPQGGCTTVPNDVTKPAGPYGGVVPIPNAGLAYNPPLNLANPAPGATTNHSIIVRKNNAGQWMDDNNGNWTNIVTGGAGARVAGWDMPDRDVAVLNANSLALTYQATLGNILMAMAVHPTNGQVCVVGTDATNEVRFEPNLNGRFLRVNLSRFSPGGSNTITDLNPHINYANSSLPPAIRTQSVGDPRGIVWKSDGSKAYVTGMGSNNVVVIDPSGARIGSVPITVGEGPTGIVLDELRNKAYVLNKFEGTISTVDLGTNTEVARANFFDPTPQVIKAGRKHLYNTHLGSGNGHISCGSCHVDGRWDRLGWDLGNPAGNMETVGGNTFHPMKGVKTTQFLIDIIGKGTGNLHWRGDKTGFQDFAGAFQSLQGLSAPKDAAGMQEFSDFLNACWYVPNPYRTYRPESTVAAATERMNPSRVRWTGTDFQAIPSAGVKLFVSVNFNCSHCHQTGTGRGNLAGQGSNVNAGVVNVTNNVDMVPDLRSVYRKNGFFYNTTECTSGFGLMSDGTMETVFNQGGTGQYLGDYEPELLSWSGGVTPANSQASQNFPLVHVSQDAMPAVGLRHTLNGASIGTTTQLDFMKALVNDYPTTLGMIVKGVYQNEKRGFYYLGADNYQSDMAGQTVTHAQLVAAAQAGGSPLSWTIVGAQVKVRMGVDADADGTLDKDDQVARVNMRVFLAGPYDASPMRADLVANGLLPNTDPYGLGATASPAVMAFTGLAAPVDWAVVELRNSVTPTTVVASAAVLIQRNGNLMMPSGEQTITFGNTPAGTYHVAVKHRNHLGAMTFTPLLLRDPGTLLDLTLGITATYGTNARQTVSGGLALWAADVSGDGLLKYTGSNNDRDLILVRIGGTVPTNTTAGYWLEDVNLDGVVRYTGGNNDRDPILQNIGGSTPTNTRIGQLP